MSDAIEGLKLIKQTGRANNEDDPSFPFKLEMNFSPPEFMTVTYVALYGGSEELVVRGMTKAAIDQFLELNDLRHHPRLRRFSITGPDGVIEISQGRAG